MNIVWGYGVVGQATAHALGIEYHYDVDESRNNTQELIDVDHYFGDDVFFVCVPTPTMEDGSQNLDFLRESILEITNIETFGSKNIVIRSTVLPGTCRKLQDEFDVNLIFVPEFLTESTAFADAKYPDFVFVGGDDFATRNEIAEMFHNDNVFQVSLETAELVKYAMNTFFGIKVVLGNIFRDIAEQTGADYWSVKKALELHKFGSLNGWNPFHGNQRGFGGKCLPKDITALSKLDKTGLLKKLLEVNESYRK